MSGTWTWRKSSRSLANGDCVEIARPQESVVGLRNSKAPHTEHLRLPSASFDALLADLKTDLA